MKHFHPCLVIPCYNHGRELLAYLPRVTACGYPVIVVDDGSAKEEASLICQACAATGATLITLQQNGGKWRAVLAGMDEARRRGYTHVLQCDADGQHNEQHISEFLDKGEQHPAALICGQPRYGEDVPPARLYGRRITNFFVSLETAGACHIDAMCGFRLYPLERTLGIIQRGGISSGMAGDIELLVRCCWDGMPVLGHEVEVCYPEGGRSNFRMLRDNVLISWAHTKLCTAALLHPWRLVRAHRPR